MSVLIRRKFTLALSCLVSPLQDCLEAPFEVCQGWICIANNNIFVNIVVQTTKPSE